MAPLKTQTQNSTPPCPVPIDGQGNQKASLEMKGEHAESVC